MLELDNPISGNFTLTVVGSWHDLFDRDQYFQRRTDGSQRDTSNPHHQQRGYEAVTLGNNTSVTLGSSGQTGNIVYVGGTASSNMPFVLAAGGTGQIGNFGPVGTNLTLNGTISGTGTLDAVIGRLTLGGSNTFTGGVKISCRRSAVGQSWRAQRELTQFGHFH